MSSETQIGSQIAEDFPNDEAPEAAQHVFLRQALGKTAAHVVGVSLVRGAVLATSRSRWVWTAVITSWRPSTEWAAP